MHASQPGAYHTRISGLSCAGRTACYAADLQVAGRIGQIRHDPRHTRSQARIGGVTHVRHQATHAVRQDLGQPRRGATPRRHLHPLHRPPPCARGHQPAGVRGPAHGRAASCAARTAPSPSPTTTSRPSAPASRATSRKTTAASRSQTLEKNVVEFGVPYIPILDVRQGIVHIIGPELGLSLPGMTIVCGDSHTSTHGALGALAFGIGTSEVEHVMATQTLLQNAGEEHADRRVRHARLRLFGQGHRAGDHRQDHHRRRQRPCHRIHRRHDPRAGHGRAHDGRRTCRSRRARAPA